MQLRGRHARLLALHHLRYRANMLFGRSATAANQI
jgi:hypothetical protein